MGNKGEILASDLQEKKLTQIAEGAHRLGLDILRLRAMDARALTPAEIGSFDMVFVDAPCSGFGIIRKKPEIRDKSPEEIARLPEIQLAILKSAARCVAPGGTLLYATCTILPEENGDVVAAFLAERGDFAPESFSLPGELGEVREGDITLYPHIHGTDGFFFCKLRRVT
jgi:16S rRNA (cytosine967-C5)-methyltransferase